MAIDLTTASKHPTTRTATPSPLVPTSINSSAAAVINGASSMASFWPTPDIRSPSLLMASPAASTLDASKRENDFPSFSFSTIDSLIPFAPLCISGKRSPPAFPNNATAAWARSAGFLIPTSPSAIRLNASSGARLTNDFADSPIAFNASSAGPPLTAAVDMATSIFCKPPVNCSLLTPARLAACCKPVKASVLIPKRSDNLATVSMASMLRFTKTVRAPTVRAPPAIPAKLVKDLAAPVMPWPNWARGFRAARIPVVNPRMFADSLTLRLAIVAMVYFLAFNTPKNALHSLSHSSSDCSGWSPNLGMKSHGAKVRFWLCTLATVLATIPKRKSSMSSPQGRRLYSSSHISNSAWLICSSSSHRNLPSSLHNNNLNCWTGSRRLGRALHRFVPHRRR